MSDSPEERPPTGAATSRDGTRIAYDRSGEGPPLVLVHGTTSDRNRWRPIRPALDEHFTVYAVDRRGRGDSGDTEPYSLEREFEDVAAVVDAIGGPVDLLGHSHGALCSMEAARVTGNVRKLVLYEPPIPLMADAIYPDGIIDRLQGLLDEEDREGVVTTFFREVVRMPDRELATLRSHPTWADRVAAAHTIPRELRADERYQFDPTRFEAVTVPTLLLLGGDSPAFFEAGIEALHEALPNSRIAILEGQQHVAINTAPDRFVEEVVPFLLETG